MARLYLDLADFHTFCLFEYLNHSDPYAIHFDEQDMPPGDALGKVAFVTSFIPTTPCRIKQLPVDAPSKALKPRFIFR
jgi:hypothetical protein